MKRIWLALILFFASMPCFGQNGAFDAPIGQGTVGYRAEWVKDISRSWPIPDASGRLRRSPRWVQVHIWYPAVVGSGEPMTFRNYMETPRGSDVPTSVADAIHGNDWGNPSYSFRGIYRQDEGRLQQALNTPVVARSWADPADGKFPVVVYSVGQNDFTQDSVSLAEFLASNGYIVATVPQLGTGPRRALLFVHDPLSYEAQLRDLEVALTHALKLKNADEQKIVAVGHSYGGIYALLLAMRSNAIVGVIGLDPTYIAQRAGYEYDLRKFPYFDADLRVPIVTLRRGSGSVNRSLLDSFVRAERLEVVYPDLMHGDFATVPFLQKNLPSELLRKDETDVRSPRAGAEGASVVFNQVLDSLGQILDKRKLSAGIFASTVVRQSVTYTPSDTAPSEEELYWIYKSQGLRAAENAVTTAKSARRTAFDESRLIAIANEQGYSNKPTEALEMFRLVAFAFPDSANAQSAAADAFMDAGQKDEARRTYQRVLKLDPNNQTAKDGLVKLR